MLSILEQQGVQLRSQGLPGSLPPEAIELYLQGWSLKRVGAYFGCSADAIRVALNTAGISLRKPWEPMPTVCG